MKRIKFCLILTLIIISSIFIYLINKKEYLSTDDILGVYINDELSDKIPAKDEALFQKSICDDENVKVTWDNDNWGLLISNFSKKVKCNLYFYSGPTVFDFDYTGSEQTFTVPISGTYKLETWGAQGMISGWGGESGCGGYSSGLINLKESETIFINTGGTNGYNGGNISSRAETFGGGATHFATKSGLLSELENYKDDILIVSGGAGGAERQRGGDGGGYIGNSGSSLVSGWQIFGKGGTQNSGGTGKEDTTGNAMYDVNGTFGHGGYGTGNSDSGAYGGGGFYGGGATTGAGGAGGGSGYIGNPLLKDKVMYCYNCEESNEVSNKTISTTCNEEMPTSYCAKKGNGYARITLISIDE